MRKMAWKPWRHIFWCDGGVNVGRRLITGAAAATTPDAAASLLHVCVVGSGPAGFYTAEKVDLILVECSVTVVVSKNHCSASIVCCFCYR
jgi:hypothetical protein